MSWRKSSVRNLLYQRSRAPKVGDCLKLETISALVEPELSLNVVAEDPDDNRVLECAVSGRADYVISGDRHLLKLKEHGGIPILTAREFLNAMVRND